jgi:hypothetical protein
MGVDDERSIQDKTGVNPGTGFSEAENCRIREVGI